VNDTAVVFSVPSTTALSIQRLADTDVLEKLAKTAGGGFMAALGGSKKFGALDIKVSPDPLSFRAH
jgi:hypothetical protein